MSDDVDDIAWAMIEDLGERSPGSNTILLEDAVAALLRLRPEFFGDADTVASAVLDRIDAHCERRGLPPERTTVDGILRTTTIWPTIWPRG